MYGQDFAPMQHRFNPNAPAYHAGGYGASAYAEASYQQQQPQADFTPYPMNAAALAEQQHQPGPQRDMHQASFGSTDTSFSETSAPTSGPASNAKRRRHNPYASSNASSSEPSSPAVAPAAASTRVPADSAFAGYSSSNTSTTQSPVYAPEVAFTGDATNNHPIAYSINEQFAQARGTLAAAACTARGRHMLVGALRQQHTDKIQAIFEEIAPNVSAVVMDPQGGHVVRTMLEFLNEQQVADLVSFLTPEVVLTIATSSQNTRRVLQTLFERHRTPALQPVIDVIAAHAIALATTQQGCIAVMRSIEHATDMQKHQVLNALTPQLAALTMDPYGNYVVQSVLQYFPREVACEVIEKAFNGHWVNLSCNKFASNVMEKFIQASTPLTRKTILDELVYTTEALATLMQDGFGNFVLQQIIDTCTTGPEFRKLAEKVRPQLTTSPFGHKIEAKLKSKRFGPPHDSKDGSASSQANRHNAGQRSGKDAGRRSKGGKGTDSAIASSHDGKEGSSRSTSNLSTTSTPIAA